MLLGQKQTSVLAVFELGAAVWVIYLLFDCQQTRPLYAAGDVTGGVLQVATAVGEGAIAGVSVFNYLRKPYWSRL